MIRVTSLKKDVGTDDNSVIISAFADSKTEVTSSATFVGLPKDAKIGQSSTVITASGEIAFRKSDGTWNWV